MAMATRSGLTVQIDNGDTYPAGLAIDTEQIDVTVMSKSKPDMAWEHIDSHGHFHAYDKDGHLPTLESRSVHVDCACQRNEYDPEGWDCDGYDETVYHCAICDEVVEPKVITWSPIGREYAPGRTTWIVTVAAELERGQKVSVRLRSGSPMDEQMMFGIGVVTAVEHDGSADGRPVASASIHGVSPLAQRKTKAPALS